MGRPAGKLANILTYKRKDVYAPWCDGCGSDYHTRWDDLPEEISPYSFVVAMCLHCEKVLYPSVDEAYAAREPERLAARLAELKASSGDAESKQHHSPKQKRGT